MEPRYHNKGWFQYGIIARLEHGHHAPTEAVCAEIAEAVSAQVQQRISRSYVTYKWPNYIIYLYDPHLQTDILSMPYLETRNFRLKMVPWCIEYELGQLPWIQGSADEDYKITIDPLTILPIPAYPNNLTGSRVLKDNYVKVMGTNCDLRAPDFSYVLIVELRDFYEAKFRLYRKCKGLATGILQALQSFMDDFKNGCYNLSDAINDAVVSGNPSVSAYMQQFGADVKQNADTVYLTYGTITNHVNNVQGLSEQAINLDSFRMIPPLQQVSVPSSYVTRLKSIYSCVAEKIYKGWGPIVGVETSEGKFEAFVSVNGSLWKLKGNPQWNAASAELEGLMYCLKRTANLFGYQIMDLNYGMLTEVMTSINTLSTRVNMLQRYVSYARTDIDDVFWGFGHMENQYGMASFDGPTVPKINDAMNVVTNVVNNCHGNILSLIENFYDAKMEFLETHMETEVLAGATLRWVRTVEAGKAGS